jgi:hypothetical protein
LKVSTPLVFAARSAAGCAAPQPTSSITAADAARDSRVPRSHRAGVLCRRSRGGGCSLCRRRHDREPGSVDALGKDAIRALYANALAATSLHVRFHTEEIASHGDLAYERGTYDLDVTDKTTGRNLQTVTRSHVHILKKQPNGDWKTWRMFTDSTQPTTPEAGHAVITKEFAQSFAHDWIEAWNSHDLDRFFRTMPTIS